MDTDYSTIESRDYTSIMGQSIQTPPEWKLNNRFGYQMDEYYVNGNRQANIMVNNGASPKSYAALTGGTAPPTPNFATIAQSGKVRFETTISPDYETYSGEAIVPRNSISGYYENIPSGNLNMAASKIAMLSRK